MHDLSKQRPRSLVEITGNAGKQFAPKGQFYYVRELTVFLRHGLRIRNLVPGTCRLVVRKVPRV